MELNTDIIKRHSVEQVVATYQQVCAEVREGYAVLQKAQVRLADIAERGTVAYCESRSWGQDFTPETAENVIAELKKAVWAGIVCKLNIRNVMDSKQRETLDKQLETGEGLPEITTDAILDVVGAMVGNLQNYATAAIVEAFNLIRRDSDGYKSTEQCFKIGDKAVLTWTVEQAYERDRWRVGYNRCSDKLITLENAFRMLDGKGPSPANVSDLEKAIQECVGGNGETEYFRFRCFKNRNLHIWFKKMNLVKLMNEAGGNDWQLNRAQDAA